MSASFRRSVAAVNEEATRIGALLNGGYLRLYSGTQPATADTPPSGGEHLLAELRFGSPAFGSPSNGVVQAHAITPDADAAATDTVTWFRAHASNGVPICDGSVGRSGADLNLNSTAVQRHAEVSVSSFTYAAIKSL